MLVVPHQKTDVEPAEPLIARDDIGSDLLVRGPKVRAAVDVVNRGGKVEAVHDFVCAPYDCTAIACTSLTDTFFAAASLAQSSNSGTALITRPSRHASLNRTVPRGVSTFTISRRRHALDLVLRQSDVRRLARNHV